MSAKKATKTAPSLDSQVIASLGPETYKALAAQPLALAAKGGPAALLREACKAAANQKRPVEYAVALFRIYCGSSAKPS